MTPRRAVRARARRVSVEARAKLNLTLRVGPRRPDGFHDLATVFQTVSLADTLIVTPRPRGFRMTVRKVNAAVRGRSAAERIPAGPSNLVLRAARLVARHAALGGGAHFSLIKRIPSGAGLGGGSADAAAAIVALERLYGFRLRPAQRAELAAAIGSDVPFALTGGTAIGTGRGERLRPVALRRPFRAILAVPAWRVSTAEAYARITRRKNRLTGWSRYLDSLQRLGRKQLWAGDAVRLGNDFEGALDIRRTELHSLHARLRAAGVTDTRMTGSGSALFGVLDPGATARDIVARFVGREALFVVRSLKRGLTTHTLP